MIRLGVEQASTRDFGDFDAAYGGWDIDGEPYTKKKWNKVRLVSLYECWAAGLIIGGRISLSDSDHLDFKRKSSRWIR